MNQRITIYQVLPRLFGNTNSTNEPHGSYEMNGAGKLNDFTPSRIEAIKSLGASHIWYTGVIEHATKTEFGYGLPGNHPAIVKGEAGSPYAITDYYDIAPALASSPELRMREFEALVERTHQAGLSVIIDFVPNHLSRDYHSDAKPDTVEDFGAHDNTEVAFDPQNNFYYIPGIPLQLAQSADPNHPPYREFPAKVTGNDVFSATPSDHDWYETIKLNYGVDYTGGGTEHFSPIPDTWQKMLDILRYWASKGVDGFRCDMAEMVPPAFWQWAITRLKNEYPYTILIAEVYQPHRYAEYIEAGFDLLYDKVGLYDKLIGVLKGECKTSEIYGALSASPTLQSHLLHFMENHDEQRLSSDFISGDGSKAFPAMCASSLVDGCPIMVYFGQELGERGMNHEGYSGRDGRTSIFDYWSVSTVRDWLGGKELKLREQYTWLLHVAQMPVFTDGLFYDLTYTDASFAERGLFVFLRALETELAIVVVNFQTSIHRIEVTIPPIAYQLLSVSHDSLYMATDLRSNRKNYTTLSPTLPYSLVALPYMATVHHLTVV